jgi:DNA-damage-inducible protein D
MDFIMSEEQPAEAQGKIVVFGARRIRRAWVDEQWYFSVVDIVAALTDSPNARDYWYRMKRREMESSGIQLSTLCRQLKLTAADGKSYVTEVASTKNAFRIIQSIPSPKAEPFKQWLAQVGHERIQEIENPELADSFYEDVFKFAFPTRTGYLKQEARLAAYVRLEKTVGE